ncbi:MAG TPA: M23 family metallopeptidase [Tenuifilaceae bacterium]|nr:M23 family metallopeptidase [Tenuifilaceae bacterium]HPE17123.1 M23 family metallopeptidase [Tenuifilaceae bacterium]HPJ45851.1 M23 family metallopeptidase [Tenuifilaceae bacterium]HPQ34118.1 M23 family metallopeptidase [Tenuifilaceae bacterium]HRX68696.1 M23 family metallopeptidase [Tenuifilaceae bacterium]
MRFVLKIFSSFAFILAFFPSHSQPENSPFNLYPPLKGNLYLSGVFGEVRTNHFHSGIDFRTGGKIGAEVFSSEKGYVSRIRVGGNGFGKALYINHPNNLTTAYAHLDRFTDDVEQLVKEHQYQNESFEVDIYLKPGVINVERGQLIGWSGNSGSSGGPHLHYEVRESTKQTPLNPHFSNLKIADNLFPVIQSAYIYQVDYLGTSNSINNRRELKVQKSGNSYLSPDTIMGVGLTSFGIEAYDYVNQGSTRCGIYEIEMLVNDSVFYHFQINQFDFSETRFANSHIDYSTRQLIGKRVHKLFLEPNNKFNSYKSNFSNGLLNVEPDSLYNIKVFVGDAYGNRTSLTLVVKGASPLNLFSVPGCPFEKGSKTHLLFYCDSRIKEDKYSVFIPKNSLYHNLWFNHGLSEKLPNTYSPVIHLHDTQTPVHNFIEIKIRVDSVPERIEEKLLLGTFDSKGKIEAVDANYSDGYVSARLRSFGDFFVMADTIPPTILPLNINEGKNLSNQNDIRFRVTDDFSGVKGVKGYIDGKWVLFEQDPKNDLAFFKIDPKRLTSNTNHVLLFHVEDTKGNFSLFECNFFW